MLSAKPYLLFYPAILAVLSADGSYIKNLDIPAVLRNGSKSVDLVCNYDVRENEKGLVIKWYHESEQIYQWIPPMPPQDVGIINGFAEYPPDNLKDPNSRSIIHLKTVNADMTGVYTCSISTFQEEASQSAKMIVYVPESKITLLAVPVNETHLNLTCTAEGIRPRPLLAFYIEGSQIDEDQYYLREDPRNTWTRNVILESSLQPAVVDCEISIPETDYKRRRRIVYYPVQFLLQTSSANDMTYLTLFLSVFFTLLNL